MNHKLVSIIIPCFNAERTLPTTLDSILWQSYQEWECLLIDDGSTDASAELFRSYSQRDSRFKYFRQVNQGPSRARNAGVMHASGGFIQFLDADDLLLKDRLQVCVELLESNSSADIIYTDAVLFHPDHGFIHTMPAKIPENDTVRALLFELNVTFAFFLHSLFFRKSVVERFPFNETLPYWAEDQDCWVRMAMGGMTFFYCDRILAVYRISSSSLTSREAELIAAKISMLEQYKEYSLRTGYTGIYESSILYLQQRLVFAYYMERSFAAGFSFMKSIWRQSNGKAKIKMIGWLLLMLFFTKKFILDLRAWIVTHTPFKWGGWKYTKPWNAPDELLKLMELT